MSVYPFPRHYLPLVVLLAVRLDSLRSSSAAMANARGAFAVIAILVCTMNAWEATQTRQTNVDIIAAKLTESTSEKDYILVYPWYMSVSFNHYYEGNAPWTSVPPLDDYWLTRYDLFNERMTQRGVMDGVLERIEKTVDAGGHVSVLGKRLPQAFPGAVVPEIEPAPHPDTGWFRGTYGGYWGSQVAALLEAKAGKGNFLTLDSEVPINEFETMKVTLFRKKKSAR